MKKMVRVISFVCALIMIFSSCAKEENVSITFQDNPIDRDNYVSGVKDPGIERSAEYLSSPKLSHDEIKAALDFVMVRVDENVTGFMGEYPRCYGEGLTYPRVDNTGWTEGFFIGMIWLAYEYTGDVKYKHIASDYCDAMRERLDKNISLEHHDIGFLYYPSCVKGYMLTGDERMKDTALKAADKLLTRYNEKGKYIQAWGEFGSVDESRLIIDTMMNLELLYWASEESGNQKYFDVANNHAKTTAMVIMRDDASTHHTFYINPKTGNPSHGVTDQGLNDDTAWSRGQAWGVYGFNISYHYTKNPLFMEEGTKTANYFLNNLPSDNIAYWDLSFTSGEEPRDTSAAAIVASGLIDNYKYYDNEYKNVYLGAAHQILKSLGKNYTTKDVYCNSVLKEGVYSYHDNLGIDTALIWGDYYYMEALMKLWTM
ncbi:MAG: glycoside hydrolase family 88 protein [Clostridia bacterium]|nr:glycoside hydrolase family 88 protein [Clostridia bacterium]